MREDEKMLEPFVWNKIAYQFKTCSIYNIIYEHYETV
jgi:hypothetical protein